MQKTWRWFGKQDPITLSSIKAIGVEGIVTSLHHVPNGEIWELNEILDLKSCIEDAGLEWSVVESLPVSEGIKYQGNNLHQLLENYKISLENLGKAGIKTVCYNFMPVIDWIRTDLMKKQADGTFTLYFNYVHFAYFDCYILAREGAERDYPKEVIEKVNNCAKVITNEEKNQLIDTIFIRTQGFINGFTSDKESSPVESFKALLNNYSNINKSQLRENLKYFLEQILPIAETYNINMCIHPDDPPFAVLGLPRIVTNEEDMDWILNAIPSPNNGLTFCAGSLSSGMHNDVPTLAEKFANRTHFVHLRSTQVFPNGDFIEAPHLEGRAHISQLITIFNQQNPKLPMRIDHGILMPEDVDKNYHPGYSFLGRKKALQTIAQFMSILAIFLFSVAGLAQVHLPKLISNGMVLQRNAKVELWGWASPQEKITIEFQNHIYHTVASRSDGKWKQEIKNLEENGPYTMIIKAKNTITINNVLVGDVWLCSGQSNMEHTMRTTTPLYDSLIAHTTNANIHYFNVPQEYNFQHKAIDFTQGEWVSITPQTLLNCSAVAYFFAQNLNDTKHTPIGIINASLGGSPAEAWISEQSIKKFPHYYDELQHYKNPNYIDSIKHHDQARNNNWYAELNKKDKGYTGVPLTMTIPGYWNTTSLGSINGSVWFEKNIHLPTSANNKPALLELGRIVDADSVYINNQFVGSTSYQYPQRRYTIPKGILKGGDNSILIRVINSSGNGGFVLDKPYRLTCDTTKIDLSGDWNCILGAKMPPLASQTFVQWKPVGLFNSMIAPLIPYTIKGIAWYQGESNASRAKEYTALLSTLIRDWRMQWKQGNIPFLIVQLPNFMESKADPSESDWAELREAQSKTLSVANTGMAVTIDLGEWNDVHPLNKRDVGYRLSLIAEKVAYHNDTLIATGPTYQYCSTQGKEITIHFANAESGLITSSHNNTPTGFAIAGENKHFVWAQARIVNQTAVVVWNDSVPNPKYVRYAWADNPTNANLYNKALLPAAPFTISR